jgi:biopolymer transport protein ExbD
MRRKHSRRPRKPVELLLVPMIDIFTVLVTFLLMTAVFSRITILELDLPSAASNPDSPPVFRLEVIVRKQGLELTNGSALIARIPNLNGEYDLKSLSTLALSLKRDNPDASAASVLLEPEIEYDHLIQVMDAIRTADPAASDPAASESAKTSEPVTDPAPALPAIEVAKLAAAKPPRVALFTDIAVGDAP